MAFGKKPIKCKLGNLGEARSVYTQTSALTSKNCMRKLPLFLGEA